MRVVIFVVFALALHVAGAECVCFFVRASFLILVKCCRFCFCSAAGAWKWPSILMLVEAT
jgi:hypothetical protein